MTSAGNFAMLGMVRKHTFLPYDEEVEYLQSTGTQYIDTGLKATEKTAAVTRVAWTVLGYDKIAFGIDNGATFSGGFNLQTTSNGNVFRFVRGNQYKDTSTPSRPVADTFFNIEVGPNGISVDGVLAAISDTSAFTTIGNLPLFAWRRGANLMTSYMATVRLGPTKIYDGSSLVRDFISVRFTNELGQPEGAMYDRVSGALFRNAGTGAFVIGPDVGSYVETDGNCWFNTGIFLRTPLRIECDYYLPERGAGQSVWGAYVKSDIRIQQQSNTSNTSRAITFTYNGSYINVSSSSVSPYYPYRSKAVFEVEAGYQKITTDFAEGTGTVSSGLGETMTAPCCLFGYGRPSAGAIGFAPSGSRIYSWKCFMAGSLVSDMVPSLGPDGNTPCFYDKVSGNYVYNMGSGTPRAVIVQ